MNYLDWKYMIVKIFSGLIVNFRLQQHHLFSCCFFLYKLIKQMSTVKNYTKIFLSLEYILSIYWYFAVFFFTFFIV